MRKYLFLTSLFFILITSQMLQANTVVIDFEGLSDLELVTNQYPGVVFTNSIVLTAGISLNEFEFPPKSGDNVISDDGGPISISFAAPITSFSGFFTYITGLTLTGFDASNIQIGMVSSLYGNNSALSGDSGSSPNELLSLNYAGGISSVSIAGDPLGGSFTLDDLTYSTPSQVPEPSTISLFVIGGIALFLKRKKIIR